jgi:hypothetical protein
MNAFIRILSLVIHKPLHIYLVRIERTVSMSITTSFIAGLKHETNDNSN